jgi:hypothetical protein
MIPLMTPNCLMVIPLMTPNCLPLECSCALGRLHVHVNSIAHDGALNCTTPPQPMAHARFAISINGRDFTAANGVNAHVGGVNARDREFSSAIRAHDSASLRYRANRQAVHSVWPLGAPASGRTVITLSGEGFTSFGSVGGAVVGGAVVGEGGVAGLAACRFLPVDAPSRACEDYDEARLRHSTLARCRSRAAVVFRAAAAALAASAGAVETPVGSAVGSKYRGGMGGGMGADLSGGYDETGADLSRGNETGAVMGAAAERLGSGYTDTIICLLTTDSLPQNASAVRVQLALNGEDYLDPISPVCL